MINNNTTPFVILKTPCELSFAVAKNLTASGLAQLEIQPKETFRLN